MSSSAKQYPNAAPTTRKRSSSVNKRPLVLAKAVQQSADVDGTDLAGNLIDKVAHLRIFDTSEISAKYEFLELLGEGAFGKVKLVKSVQTGKVFASKMIKKKVGNTETMKQIDREILILKKCRHRNIITLEEVFETPDKVYMILEFCDGGDLMNALKYRFILNEDQAKFVGQQIIDAVTYLHDYGVVHRDLKPENILLMKQPDLFVKIADFGLVTFHDACDTIESTAGTPFYMAPEVFQGNGYSQQCDIWSIGIILYLMITSLQVDLMTVIQQVEQMLQGKRIEYPQSLWSRANNEAQSLISLALKWNPAERLTAKEMLSHRWFTKESEGGPQPNTVINMMKSFNAERRLRKVFTTVRCMCRWMKQVNILVHVQHEQQASQHETKQQGRTRSQSVGSRKDTHFVTRSRSNTVGTHEKKKALSSKGSMTSVEEISMPKRKLLSTMIDSAKILPEK